MALPCLIAGLSCFGQSGPGQQRLVQVKAWKGTLKIVRNVSLTTATVGGQSGYSANTVIDLTLNLDKFDGRMWTGTAMGTANFDETLTTDIPGCKSVANGKAIAAVSAMQFALNLNSGSDTFGFLLFDPSLITMNVTTTVDCGGTKTTNTAPGSTLWYSLSRDQQLSIPATGFALQGTGTAKGLSALGAVSVDHTLTYNLNGEAKELEVIVDPSGFNSWRPEATRDGTAPGNSLPVTARLQYTDGSLPQTDADKAQKFTFELLETSKEPGVAINWPRDASDSDFDMRIAPADGLVFDDQVKRQRAEKSSDGGMLNAAISVESFDWGGWSRLKVTAELPDGRKVVGYLAGDKSQTEIRLPKRSASSLIADAWKQAHPGASGSDSSDDEAEPAGDGHTGDGLTLYEEYRGFYENGEHIEGDPKKKEYFAVNLAGKDGSGGLALFHRLSGLLVHSKLFQTELSFDRIINKNVSAGPHRVDQHGIIVRVQGFDGYAEAVRLEPQGGPSTPRDFQFVGLPVGLPQRPTASAAVSYASATVAHELFHTVNVYHHGESDVKATWTRGPDDTVLEDGAPIRVLREDGTDVTARVLVDISRLDQMGQQLTRWIGIRGGQHSGFEDCVMRYDNANAYRSDADSSVRYTVAEIPGAHLCETTTGVNVNDPSHSPQSRYGPASSQRGACKRQILVNDGVSPPLR